MPLDRRQLTRFVALTFGISWMLWLPSVLRSTGAMDLPEVVGLLGLFAVLGPTVAAFVLVGRESGRAGMARLLRNASAALLPAFFATSLGRWTTFAILLSTVSVIGAVWGWKTLNCDRPVPRPSIEGHSRPRLSAGPAALHLRSADDRPP